jgi:hypothetical protein
VNQATRPRAESQAIRQRLPNQELHSRVLRVESPSPASFGYVIGLSRRSRIRSTSDSNTSVPDCSASGWA